MSPLTGSTVSHFRITAKLGEGGMGEVYRAEDTKLGREVAIKVLPEVFTADPERLARFEREARVLASLNHPHIAAIHGIEEAEDRRFLVLELAEGETLQDRIARGPVPMEEALAIARQVAEALEAAHAKGIIHRDLKPSNVKVTAEGKVKVLDFGLAKAFEPAAGGGDAVLTQSPTLTQQMTGAGTILGTAAYMSPEQARGKAVDKRADLWAFGVLLYEMLSGQRAFAGETVTDVFASIVAREPDWEALPARTPRAIRRLLRRCLEKDPERRLRDVADARLEIEEALKTGLAEAGAEEEPAAGRRRERLWMAAAALLALLAAGLGLLAWRLAAREEPVVRAFVPPPEGGSFHLDPVAPGPVAVSPGGRHLAYSARGADGPVRLWVRGIDDLTARPLAGTEGAAYPFWSPDGRFVGFFAGGKLKKIEIAGGPPLTLCEASNGKGGTWNRQGVIVFAPAHNTPLHRVAAAGGEPVALTELDSEKKENSHRHPRFLPDGQHFLYLARVGAVGQATEGNRIMVASLDGGEARELMLNPLNVGYAAGHLLYVREGTLMARPFHPGRLAFTGDPFPLAEEVVSFPGASLGVFSASGGGVLAYQSGAAEAGTSALLWRDRSGNQTGQVGSEERYGEVHLSPDGELVAVSITDTERGTADVWLWNLEREIKTRFTFDAGNEVAIAWSPDGERLAFASDREGQFDLFAKPVAGAGEEELLYRDELSKFPTSWSPDGRHLLYLSIDQVTQFDIWALPLEDGGEPFKIQETSFDEVAPAISPDGRWVAYASDESGRYEVYVTAFPAGGRKWQVSTAGGVVPRWRRDSRELYYATEEGLYMAAEVEGRGADFAVAGVRELFEGPTNSAGYDYDVAADGERFLLNSPASEGGPTPPLTLVVNWTADLAKD